MVDPQIDGPAFGDGPWWNGGDDEGETVRDFLARVVKASIGGQDSAEVRLWTSKHEPSGLPWWKWVAAWAERRVTVLMARFNDYPHESRDVEDYVNDTAAGRGEPSFGQSEDGTQRVYDFPDGTWLAFERSPSVSLPAIGIDLVPFCWKQLKTRPALHFTQESTSLAMAAARKGDPDGAALFVGAEDVFGAELVFGQPSSLCVECFEETDSSAVKTPAGTLAHVKCWAERSTKAKGVQRKKGDPMPPSTEAGAGSSRSAEGDAYAKVTKDANDLADEIEAKTAALNEGQSALADLLGETGLDVVEEIETPDLDDMVPRPIGDGRPTMKDAPAPEWEDDDDDFDLPEPSAGGADTPEIPPRLMAGCTREGCTTNLVMLESSWKGRDRFCPTCQDPLMAWPVTAGRPISTADLLPGRPERGSWPCDLCGQEPWRHLCYTEGTEHKNESCSGFVPPTPSKGSICTACLHVVPWSVEAPAVWNVCDSCGVEGDLSVYTGRAQLEALREDHTKAQTIREKIGEPEAPICEACKAQPADVRFTRPGKKHPIVLACRPCSKKPEVRGRRTSCVEV